MYQIDTPTSVLSKPATPAADPDNIGFFTGGVPGDPNNVATIVPAWWLNMIQSEMLSVLEAAGIAPNKAIDTQFGQAVAALAGSVPTGSVMGTIKTAAPNGWLFMNGQTIGNLASGADHAGSYEALYTDLYGIDDAYAPVTGGRSGVAVDDFNAGKPIALLEATGRALIGAGQGTGLAINHPLGSILGEEMHTLTVAELASHRHTIGAEQTNAGNGGGLALARQSGNDGTDVTTFSGDDAPHNVMQPSLALNLMIKV